LGTLVLSQSTEYGATVSVATVAPSIKNSTVLIGFDEVTSDAIDTVPETTDPVAGEVTVT
jgi:hypothetical protein